jgi:hypothetical protein
MGREEKFDLDNVANELARHGPVESIKWVGDPEKMSEIFERSAKASSRMLARHRDYAQYGRMSKPVAKTGGSPAAGQSPAGQNAAAFHFDEYGKITADEPVP